MSIRVAPNHDGGWELIVENEPPFVQAMQRDRQDSPSTIAHGTWLFVAFSIWKVTDRSLVAESILLASSISNCSVRLYGYDFADELRELFPFNSQPHSDEPIVSVEPLGASTQLSIRGDATASPLWILFKDGRLEVRSQGAEGLLAIKNACLT
jgi:hypothetical protein